MPCQTSTSKAYPGLVVRACWTLVLSLLVIVASCWNDEEEPTGPPVGADDLDVPVRVASAELPQTRGSGSSLPEWEASSEDLPPSLASPPTAATSVSSGSATSTDLLWRSSNSGTLALWQMDGAAYTGVSTVLGTVSNLNWVVVGSADLTVDGDADLFWRNPDSGASVVWVMEGSQYTGEGRTLPSVDADWKIAGLGDFDGDGSTDLLWRRASNGALAIWKMQGTELEQGFSLGKVSNLDWVVRGVADFSGDGQADILWRSLSSGNNAIWIMDGLSYNGNAQTMPSVRNLAWDVVATEDFTGDGDPDITWHSANSGQNIVWEMNGLNFIGTRHDLPTVRNLAWQIVAASVFLDPPEASTGGATTTAEGAIEVSGEVDPEGQTTEYWFAFGQNPDQLFTVTAPQDVAAQFGGVKVTATLPELEPDRTYYYQLVARGVEDSAEGEPLDVNSPSGPPQAPTVLEAVTRGAEEIELSWRDNSWNEADFRVERKLGFDGTWTEVTTVAADETLHSDAGLDPYTEYRYRARACNASGCSDYTAEAGARTEKNWGEPATLVKVSGHGQSGKIMTTLPNPLVVRVEDADGVGVPGVPVTVTHATGIGIECCSVTSDGDGRVELDNLTFKKRSGEFWVQIEADGLTPVEFTATALPGTPYEIRVLGGEDQTGPKFQILPNPLTLRVIDSYGNAVPGVDLWAIDWEASSDGANWINEDEDDAISLDPEGTVQDDRATTNPDGVAQFYWNLADTDPYHRLQVILDSPWRNDCKDLDEDTGDARCEPPHQFYATGTDEGTNHFVMVDGNFQKGTAGETLPTLPTIRAVHASGNGAGGVEIIWQAQNGGTLDGAGDRVTKSTDLNGYSSVEWTLGSSGTNTLAAASSQSGWTNADVTFSTDAADPGDGGDTPDSGGIDEPQPAFIQIVSGDGQTGNLGETLPEPLVVQVLDSSGDPVPNAGVSFQTTDASVSPGFALTGDFGKAATSLTMPLAKGSNSVVVSASTNNGHMKSFQSHFDLSAGLLLFRHSGFELTVAKVGTSPPAVPAIRIWDLSTSAWASGVAVDVAITEGEGLIENGDFEFSTEATINTDEDGLARLNFNLWSLESEGSHTLEMRTGEAVEQFHAEVTSGVSPNASPFDFEFFGEDLGDFPALSAILGEAVDSWRLHLRSEPHDGWLDYVGTCGRLTPRFSFDGRWVDDVLIHVSVRDLDSGVLGRARTCLRREDGSPVLAVIELNESELGNSDLVYTVKHEIGHVLGIGAVWDQTELIEGMQTGDPRYVGARGIWAWRLLGGDSTEDLTANSVPVEDQYGDGTAGSHWRVSEIGTSADLMATCGGRYLSLLSLAALEDLGFAISYDWTESWIVPPPSASSGSCVGASQTLYQEVPPPQAAGFRVFPPEPVR